MLVLFSAGLLVSPPRASSRNSTRLPKNITTLPENRPQLQKMSHLSNPLATADQLYQLTRNNSLPEELRDSILYYTARLTQAAGILLRLPQDITAQANVLLFRYWVVDDLMGHEFSVGSYLLQFYLLNQLTQGGYLSRDNVYDRENIRLSALLAQHNECIRIPTLTRFHSVQP